MRLSEVSARACAFLLEGLGELGVSEEALVSGLPVTVDELRDDRTRISWDLFTRILERAQQLCGGPESLERLAEMHVTSPIFEFLARIAALFVTPQEIYWMGVRWFGRSMFWSVDVSLEDLPDGRLRETVRIAPEHRDSPEFFSLLLGALRSAPRHLGQPDSRVTMEVSPRCAVYEIEPPATPSRWWRLWRRLRHIGMSRAAVEQLRAENEKLRKSYARLDASNRELASREQELRVILCSLDRTHVMHLDRAGRIRSVFGSPGVAPRYGFGVGRIEGRYLDDLLPADGEPASDIVRQVFETGESLRSEYRLMTPTGEFFFDYCFSPILDASGQVESVILVSSDVSERKQLENALARSDRLTSIGTFAAGIAHELNNPLGAILLSAESALALGDARGDAELRLECLRDIIASSRRCEQIVKGILRFANSQESEKQSCDLNAIVVASCELCRWYVAQHDASVQLSLAPDLPPVLANEFELEQVILNLVQNAVEAGGEKTRIAIRTDRAGAFARMTVHDDGPGLPDQQLQRIFDPFYTTRGGEGGTGLGLSVVHGIVTGHGGRLRAEPGEVGTEIVVEIPLHSVEAEEVGHACRGPHESP
jgi:signal transduction histidine kinase